MFDKIIPLWLKDKKQKSIWFLISSLIVGTIFLPETNILIQAIGQLLTPILVKITLTLFLLTFGLLASFFIYHQNLHKQYISELFPKFGVLWDKNKEPYCPACKNPISRFIFDKKTNLQCIKCIQPLWLVSDNGKEISFEEAKKLL